MRAYKLVRFLTNMDFQMYHQNIFACECLFHMYRKHILLSPLYAFSDAVSDWLSDQTFDHKSHIQKVCQCVLFGVYQLDIFEKMTVRMCHSCKVSLQYELFDASVDYQVVKMSYHTSYIQNSLSSGILNFLV